MKGLLDDDYSNRFYQDTNFDVDSFVREQNLLDSYADDDVRLVESFLENLDNEFMWDEEEENE